jgi:protection of telomeres protein 1
LRQDKAALAHLREQLFKLWGDLEEKKRELIKSQTAKVLESSLPSIDTELHASIAKFPAKPGDSLPPDSDDDSSPSSQQAISKVAALSERHLHTTPKLGSLKQGVKEEQNFLKITDLTISNKGFNCCIRQYGIKVPEESVERANAGPGQRWQRQYGIFGTQIR